MKLDKKFKKAWVEALLSGKYTQCTGFMRNSKGHVCTLGLGGILKYKNAWRGWEVIGDEEITNEFVSMNDNPNVIPFEIMAGVINEWL